MGYTQKLGLLAQSVFQDSSLNVGIGAAPSGTYKLEVTGSDILVNGIRIGKGASSIASNTAIGLSALPVNTTGTFNTAIGNYALLTNTTGYGNTSVGYSAIGYNTTGFYNAAIGVNALLSNTTGTYNNALGTAALYANTTGSYNTAVGQQAGTANTTGSNNTYIGYASGFSITTGSNNTIIGAYYGTAAMANNIVLADGAGTVRYQWDGTNNAFTGAATFSSSVQADFLVVGTTAATSGGLRLGTQVAIRARNVANTANIPLIESTASDGVSVSNGALILASTGAATFSSSVTSSYGSSGANFNSNAATTGSVNAYRVSNTTGTASFGIDNSVGGDLITGGLPYATLLQSISNTALQLGTNQTARLTITSAGNVGIGTSSPAQLLTLYKSDNTIMRLEAGAATTNHWDIKVDSSARIFILNESTSNGAYLSYNSASGWTSTSDARWKTDWSNLEGSLNLINKLNIGKYKMLNNDKELIENARWDYGVKAQELLDIIPDAVDIPNDENDKYGVIHNIVFYNAVKAIQELSAQNQDLKSRLDKAGL